MNMLPSHSIDTAVIKMQERNVETCQYDLSTMAVGLLFHHNCKVQCCMVIALHDLQEHSEVSEVGGRSADFT